MSPRSRGLALAAVLFWAAVLGPARAAQAAAPALTITPSMQFSYAGTLFESGDFEAARVEFRRFIHFFPSDPRIPEAEFKAADALYHLERWEEAARAFNGILLKDRDDPFTEEAYFRQSRAFLEMGNSGYAQLVLQNFLKLTGDPDTRDRIHRELALIHLRNTRQPGKDELAQAKQALMAIAPERRQDKGTDAQIAAIEKAEGIPKKNPFLSGLFALVPGGGYLYCGRYKDALTAFGVNGGFIWAAYEAFHRDNIPLGGLITFVGTGFYTGSVYGSVTAAHKFNKARQIEILDRDFHLTGGLNPADRSLAFSFIHPF